MTLIIMFIIGIVRIFLSLYVDNILIVGNNVAFINKLKYFLKSHFKIKDLGEAVSKLLEIENIELFIYLESNIYIK